jgi:hypothetical protein
MPSRSYLPWALTVALFLPATVRSDEPATYRLDLDIAWSAATHPFEFPDGAHVTPLVGATHDGRYVLFADGLTASSGLESVAERGRTAILRAELDEARGAGRAGAVFEGNGLDAVPGRISVAFTATRQHPLVSFATMIAPSPDWFTGIAGIALFAEGTWVERYEAALWAWDAGTDAGATYAAGNADTQPRASIRLLATPHVLGSGGLKRVGTVTLARQR